MLKTTRGIGLWVLIGVLTLAGCGGVTDPVIVDVTVPEDVPVVTVKSEAVVEPAYTSEELELVGRVVMSEARGEPREGMVGVAQTIRDRSVSWGLSVTETVLAEKQFAAPYEGAISPEVEDVVWSVFMEGESEFDCVLTHFHADYVTPGWSNSKVYVGSRGGTRFYTSEKGGQ